MKLPLRTDGERVESRFVPETRFAGFKDTLHGGILSAVLDEVMVWACGVRTKRFSYCAELSVRFVRPVRPGIEVCAVGELVTNRRNKLFETRGEIRGPNNEVLATATGKYLPIDPSEAEGLLEDFDGGLAEILGHSTGP